MPSRAPGRQPARRRIEILAFQDVQLLDVAGPLQVFASTNDLARRRVGLGCSLTRTLLHHARLTGVQRLCGDALEENEAIRRLLRSLGAYPSGGIERTGTVRLCLSAMR